MVRVMIKRLDPLRVRVKRIFERGEDKYLTVSPEERQWIAYGETITYDVNSNTNWTVI